ncbi:HPC2 multi-domain protein [Streptomyces sp. NPDC052236]|uniref:HPC2 multi-domain protein n=1 Tax=Streptomyces sp. NPDC052236 TaxID=3365686 RepID=UPI0037D33783
MPAPKAFALRPAVSTPAVAPVVAPVKERPEAPSPVRPQVLASNAVVGAVLAGGRRPVPPGAQDMVGNSAVAAAAAKADRTEAGPAAPASGEKQDVKARPGPNADPKFTALKKDVGRKKRTLATSHPPPRTEAVAAQDAALPPKDDEEAQGKTANAEKMNEAKPKEFDKDAFIKAVEKAIADKAPKNLDEADKFADSGKAEEVQAEVQGQVGQGKADSAEQIATTTAAPPDTSAAVPKKVVPLTGDRPPGTPGAPDPAGAVPDRLPPAATDLSAGPAQVERQMSDAQVTEPQLKKSNEPAFTTALGEKKTAERHSATAPGQMRKHETTELRTATAQAKRLGTAAMGAMGAQRVRTGQQVGAGKTGAKSRDEEKRAQVTTLLQGVFDTMKQDVEAILDGLDKLVEDQFTRGEKLARDAFTAEHQRKMEEYKDRRYSGAVGKLRWAKDLFAGLPAEADTIFTQARDNYIRRMRQVISDVATTIGTELNRAKRRIAQGRTELHTAVDKLPAELRTIGREAAAEFSDKFDELTQSVDDKGTALVDTLATKYTDALKSVDDEIAAEKEKNKGLVAKAVDAVKAVINTILELKRLLLAVLAKAGQAVLLILKDPIGFLRNLVTAVGAGLRQFLRNIGRHLQQGIMSWLLGRTTEAGLQLPAKFDTQGIVSMLASLLGVTWNNIRTRLTRKVPAQAVAAAETAVPLVAQVRKQGVAGMWEDLKTRVGDLRRELIDKVIAYVTPTIIQAGIMWVLSLLNPASAFVRAVKLIIDIVTFIVTQARQIFEFVNAVLDAIIAIARGGSGGAPALIERALARSIPVLLGFLAALLGIGGIAAKVKQIVQALTKPVNRAIDWVIDKIVGLVKKLWAKIKPKPKPKPKKKPKTGATPKPKRRQTTRKPKKPRQPRPPTKREPRKDRRQEQDFDRILSAALRDTHALVKTGLPVEEIETRLPGIRRRHRLTGLTVVVDRVQGITRVVHFVASVNPTKKSPEENTQLTAKRARADYGILLKNQEVFQHFADHRKVIIEVRPTNPDSVRHLERGALYKPVNIKAKTVNRADVWLGVPPEKKGLVGFFVDPPPAPRLRGLNKKNQAAALDRREFRAKEREDYGAKMRRLSKKPEGPGRFVVINYIVHGYDTAGGPLKPIAGDHDLYDIRDQDGSELSQRAFNQILKDMKEGEFGVMHGAVVRWNPKNPKEREMRDKLVAQHKRGGSEGLVRFAPGQPMRFVYAETELKIDPKPWNPPAGEAG